MNPPTPDIDCALVSDIGMRRKQNQDSALALPAQGIFLVADGMGGHQGGETASRLCVEIFCRKIGEAKSPENEEVIQSALAEANQEIQRQASSDPLLQGMGTTATGLILRKGSATVVQVGDSRAYYWNDSGLWQMTQDHSLVQEKLRAGLITRDQMKTDHNKNVITRSVGFEDHVRGDIYRMGLEAGDGFLLCSDGLTGHLEDNEIWAILKESTDRGDGLQRIAEVLVESANRRGGEDNITVVLVKVRKT